MSLVRLRVPATARKGEVIEIKTLVDHAMESGHRRDDSGRLLPRKILRQFVCTFNGREVLRADWGAAIAANPYFAFYVRVSEPGTFEFTWTDDDGSVIREQAKIALA